MPPDPALSDLAYHFTGANLRDGRPVPAVGETLTHEGPIEWCESGLYAARTPWQALRYAPGPMLHMVRVGRVEREEAGGELVCRERTILASRDMTFTMRRFAADQALSVAHLWDMPEVVRDYLTTLDETKRAAAREAAWEAARDAAWVAAREAAWAAAWEAAWEAAREAAREAAWEAAAWDASWEAASQEFNARVARLFDGVAQ